MIAISWHQIFSILVLVLLGIVLVRIAQKGLSRLEVSTVPAQKTVRFLSKASRWSITLAVVLLSLQQFGMTSGIFTLLGTLAAMVAIGFVAVSSVLSHLLCSVLLVFYQPFEVGDEVEILKPSSKKEGRRGRVVQLNLFYTVLEQSAGHGVAPCLLHVPNNLFFQHAVKRHSPSKTVAPVQSRFETGEPIVK